MRVKTVDAAVGKWQGILSEFGLDSEFLRNRHGACPICGGSDRYRFDDKDGCGTWYCNQCGAGDGMKLAMLWTGLTFKECAQKIDSIIGNIEAKPIKPEYDPLPNLQRMQASLQEVDGINPVRRYLKSRGLQPAPLTRYCPEWKYWDGGSVLGTFPAMVHQFKSPDNKPLTWHITFLTKDGRKAPVPSPRKVMTPISTLSGGAIQLYRAGETLGIAEGIETAMAAHKLHGIPVWASYSATLLEGFQPPSCAKSIVIFADNDSNFTGQKSAYTLANRLALKGYRVSVEIPKQENTDFADEVTA